MSILATLSGYLPYPLALQILREPTRSLLNQGRRFEAVTLFADLAGFTPLAEALGEIGAQGTEQLTEILNGRFTPMIEEIHRWGGIVGKFAGDAMVVLFPKGEREDIALRAVACAHSLRRQIRRMAEIDTLAGSLTLRMKLGLAAGTILQMVAGSEHRVEFIYAGRPLDDAAAAEHHASPGEIVLHPSLMAHLQEGVVSGQTLEQGFFRMEGLAHSVTPAPHFPLPKAADEGKAIAALSPFLPHQIYDRLRAGQDAFVNEHRQITVLFAAFSGLDYAAEDAVDRLGNYIGRVFEVVEQYGGHVRQVEMGDKGSKVIVLFGAPVTYENDEERALACALALQELAGEIESVTEQHIGVNSGRVFVGNVGSPRRQEYAAIGDAVNLSARLMQAAEEGQVLVGVSCYQAAAELFSWRDLPRLKVKGKAEPVVVYELTGRRVGRALHLQEPLYTLPMVGRREELWQLVQVLEEVLESHGGQVVGLTAEAGMGKSRLAAEVIGQALALGYAGYGGHGISHGTTTPYLAWRLLLRGLLGVEEGRPLEEQLTLIAQRLDQVDPDLPQRLPLLGDALGLEIADNDLTASFDSKLRRDSLFALVVDLIRHQAAEGPVLLVLEDAHWLDELSRELARYVAQQVFDLPVFLLTVYRPAGIEGTPPLWDTPLSNWAEIELGPFSSKESAELIRLKLSGHTLPEALIDQIEQRAQGNPFFVDEFINLLVEQGVNLDDPEALNAVEVPSSLQRLIISRLDQLAESEKMTIRVASVIGRLFRARWLLAIYPGEMKENLLRQDLERLSTLDLVPLDKPDPELEYLFKHALTQEVAYDSLSFANRRMLHERVGAYLEQAYEVDLEGWYGILSYHYGRAALPQKEFEYVCQAAEQAARQSATRQAAAFYDRAIGLIEEHGLGTPELAFALHNSRSNQYAILGEYERLPEDAEAMSRLATDLSPAHQVKALIRQGQARFRLGRAEEAMPFYVQAADLAQQRGDRLGLLEALRRRGALYFSASDYERGKEMLLKVIAEAGEEGRQQESGACQVMGWIVYDEGDYGACERYWQRALELKQALGDKPGEALVLSNLGSLYATLNYTQKGLDFAERALALATQIGYKVGELEGWLRIGEHLLGVGAYDRTWRYFERALDISNRLASDIWGQSYIRTRMAEAILGIQAEGDRPDRSLEQADLLSREALEIGQGSGNELEGWLYHTRGRVLMRRGVLERAQEVLEESARVRRELKQWYPYAHTLSDLGELHLRRGNLAAAEAVSAELLGLLFPTEGTGIEGAEEIAASWACHRILQAVGQEAQAQKLLRHAYEALQRYAERLETEELRHSFLHSIFIHRDILQAFAADG
jgi:class 3 adenylate cyclase/tetratricopeptide (TPR) repeat protein